MLNEEKVKIMIKMASYEAKEGKEDLKIGNYRKKDYVGLRMLTSWLIITAGFFSVVGLYVYFHAEFLLDHIYKLNFYIIGGLVVSCYLFLVILYLTIAHHIYSKRYRQARKSMKPYYMNLKKLNRIYENEMQKTSGNSILRGDS